MIQVNWSHLRDVYESIKREHEIDENTPVIFYYQPVGLSKKKSTVRFGEFLHFFWTLYENNNISVPRVVVADAITSKVLYQHRTPSKEKRPSNNGNVVASWSSTAKHKRQALLKILESQIQSFDGD